MTIQYQLHHLVDWPCDLSFLGRVLAGSESPAMTGSFGSSQARSHVRSKVIEAATSQEIIEVMSILTIS